MSLVLQSSGGGSVTLDEPVTASNFTISVPAVSGTMATVDGSGNMSVTGNLSFNSGYGSVATAYGCRAWVNFNGEGTVAIRASGNVSSITDNGTGDYTVNFTNAMPNVNYATFCGGVTGDSDNGTGRYVFGVRGTSTTATSSIRVINVWTGDGASLGDKPIATVAVFR